MTRNIKRLFKFQHHRARFHAAGQNLIAGAHAIQIQKLCSALLKQFTIDDLKDVISAMIRYLSTVSPADDLGRYPHGELILARPAGKLE